MNENGSNIAITAPKNDDQGADSGITRVYETGVSYLGSISIPEIPPELVSDSVSIVSNNYDTTKAKAIDEVTLSFEYDLSINTPMVSFSLTE